MADPSPDDNPFMKEVMGETKKKVSLEDIDKKLDELLDWKRDIESKADENIGPVFGRTP